MKRIPYEMEIFDDENEELERLLLENQYREKTTHQKMNETKLWEGIEKEKAKERMLSGGHPVDSGTQGEEGKTRDILAEKVGLGSGRTYERAKPVMKKIDELKEMGSNKDSEFLKTVLNSSVSAAKDLAGLESLDAISDELKDQVINKELPVNKAVQAIKKTLAKDTKAENLTDSEELADIENTVSPSANLPAPIEEIQTDENTDTYTEDSIIIGFEDKVDEILKLMEIHELELLSDENIDKVSKIIGKALKKLNKMNSAIVSR